MSQFGPPVLISPPPPPPQGHSSCLRGNVSKRWFMSGSVSEKLCRAYPTKFISNGCMAEERIHRNKVRLISQVRLKINLRNSVYLLSLVGTWSDKLKGHEVQFSNHKQCISCENSCGSFPKFDKIDPGNVIAMPSVYLENKTWGLKGSQSLGWNTLLQLHYGRCRIQCFWSLIHKKRLKRQNISASAVSAVTIHFKICVTATTM